jgi:hypothetical protein
VPVSVLLNGKAKFFVSLAPIGGGRHWLRVNVVARKAAKIKGGDLVRVKITVLDHAAGIAIPRDLESALRKGKALDGFKAMSLGLQNHLIKGIDGAAKPQTRASRIQATVKLASRQEIRRRVRPT